MTNDREQKPSLVALVQFLLLALPVACSLHLLLPKWLHCLLLAV
jgi:hypothetical protein